MAKWGSLALVALLSSAFVRYGVNLPEAMKAMGPAEVLVVTKCNWGGRIFVARWELKDSLVLVGGAVHEELRLKPLVLLEITRMTSPPRYAFTLYVDDDGDGYSDSTYNSDVGNFYEGLVRVNDLCAFVRRTLEVVVQ